MSINYIININTINYNEKNINLKATKEELDELKDFLEIIKVTFLSFEGTLKKVKQDVVLNGVLKAEILQECGVTTEEITSILQIIVNRTFRSARTMEKREKQKDVDLYYEEDEIDILENDNLNLASIIREELVLEIDPYVKKQSDL
jgi:uncharacterized metal-binding protein YceD (DUF177 family)